MAKPPVFTSYAQFDRDRYLDRFVDEFRNELSRLMVRPDMVTMAFLDRDVPAGTKWSDEIIEALGAAQVLVCLMTPAYFTRPWCGRELEAFHQRLNQLVPQPTDVSFVIPIWWHLPVTPRPLPTRLAKFNYRDPQFPIEYDKEGVRGLAHNGRWAKFRKVADRLAELVAITLQQPLRLPDGRPVADIREIANAFDEQLPFDVRFIVHASGGDTWRPSRADDTIADAVEKTAENLVVFHREVETGVSLREGLEAASRDRQVLLFVADATEPANALLNTVNGLELPGLAVLLVDASSLPKGADAWLGQFAEGSLARARRNGLLRVAGMGEMQAQMERLVDDARRKMRMAAPAAAVSDANLLQTARSQGVDPTTLANLSGPAESAEGRS
jgi:hypothetical protein